MVGRAKTSLILAALALGLIVLVPVGWLAVRHGFDGLYGQDAYAYFDYAVGPLRANLMALKPPPHFVWPPGFPLLVALASLLFGPVPLAGQLVSLLAGALVPVFTTLLAYEIWTHPGHRPRPPDVLPLWISSSVLGVTLDTLRVTEYATLLLAGLLAALTGQLWQSSLVVMADTTGLAAATIGMWALARYGRLAAGGRSPARWLMLAAGAMALAILARWAFALVAIPATAYALLVLARQGWSTALKHGLAAGAVVLVVLAPLWGPALQSALARPDAAMPFTVDLQVYSWNPLNALRREFVTADGRLSYAWPNGLWYALAPAHRFYFTALLAVFLVPGLWAVIRRRAAAPLFLLIGWAAAIVVFHAGAPWQNFRFNLAHLPALAILVAIGVEAVALWLLARLPAGSARRLAMIALAGVVLAGMLLMARGGWVLSRGFAERKRVDLATVAWVEQQTPAGAQLLTFGLTATFQHESELETKELFALTPEDLASMLAGSRPTYLLVDVPSIETQWQGRSPSINYRWLRNQAGLAELGTKRSYTLFEVLPASP
jgi:hypothetical protein